MLVVYIGAFLVYFCAFYLMHYDLTIALSLSHYTSAISLLGRGMPPPPRHQAVTTNNQI